MSRTKAGGVSCRSGLKQLSKLNICPIPNWNWHLHFLGKSKRKRRWPKQFTEYFTLLCCGPLVLGIALFYPQVKLHHDPLQI